MTEEHIVESSLPHLDARLKKVITESSAVKEFPADTEILREGQYVKVIPVVLSGLIKVFTRHEDKELLLYYIKPRESCIMSFAAGLSNEPSRVFAITEEQTTVLLLPADKLNGWVQQFPDINSLFFHLYNVRYKDLLDTINDLLFKQLDKRLYDYLKEKVVLSGSHVLKISHRQIAGELGTAREVISRVMKKLESERKLKQNTSTIEIFKW